MIVLLKDGTTGLIDNAKVGKVVTIKAKDENGNFVDVTGEVIEILEDDANNAT